MLKNSTQKKIILKGENIFYIKYILYKIYKNILYYCIKNKHKKLKKNYSDNNKFKNSKIKFPNVLKIKFN